jgi:hypothetical protein
MMEGGAANEEKASALFISGADAVGRTVGSDDAAFFGGETLGEIVARDEAEVEEAAGKTGLHENNGGDATQPFGAEEGTVGAVAYAEKEVGSGQFGVAPFVHPDDSEVHGRDAVEGFGDASALVFVAGFTVAELPDDHGN